MYVPWSKKKNLRCTEKTHKRQIYRELFPFHFFLVFDTKINAHSHSNICWIFLLLFSVFIFSWFVFNLVFYIMPLSHRLCRYLNSEYTSLCTNDYVYFTLNSTLFLPHRCCSSLHPHYSLSAFGISCFFPSPFANNTNANRSSFASRSSYRWKRTPPKFNTFFDFYRQFVFEVAVVVFLFVSVSLSYFLHFRLPSYNFILLLIYLFIYLSDQEKKNDFDIDGKKKEWRKRIFPIPYFKADFLLQLNMEKDNNKLFYDSRIWCIFNILNAKYAD